METQRRRDSRGSAEELNSLTEAIIAAAIEVHRHLGPGLLESVYQACLEHELSLRGYFVEREQPLPVVYKGIKIECGFRVDLFVERRVIVEVKATNGRHPIHEAQTLNYIRLADLPVGLLLNFDVEVLRKGIKRVVNRFPEPSAQPLRPSAPPR